MPRQVPTFARNNKNQLIINPRKLDVQTFWLVPDAPNNPVVVGAGVASGPISLTVGQDGPFEGFFLTHQRTNDTEMHVNIYDEGLRRFMMNREIHIDNIFGRSFVAAGPALLGVGPHLMAESLWLHSSRALIFNFRDNAAGDTIYPAITGVRYYGYSNPSESLAISIEKRAARARMSSPYWMTTDEAVEVPAGTQSEQLITVTSEAHFEVYKISSVSDGDYLFRLRDNRNGRQLTNGWVHVAAGTGSGAFPLILPEPVLFQANTQIGVDFLDLSGADNDIFFTLCGRRIYLS